MKEMDDEAIEVHSRVDHRDPASVAGWPLLMAVSDSAAEWTSKMILQWSQNRHVE